MLLATNPVGLQQGRINKLNEVNKTAPHYLTLPEYQTHELTDSLKTELTEIAQREIPQNEIFIIPAHLARVPIHFRINSSINYFSFDHFVNDEAKKIFLKALLKDQELKQLSALTDSLRKTYSKASFEQKEAIAAEILKSEEKSITLNEEIPDLYQKAREQENLYWQTASVVSIVTFQEKANLYQDSITQISGLKPQQKLPVYTEISDTLTWYRPAPEAAEKPAVAAASGIIYKIQIGAYKDKIPETANKQIKKISILRKVENHVDEKGVKVYTTGNLRLYPEAATMLGQVKQEGIKNAVIAAYQNGKTINITEARKLNNEL